MEFGQCEKSTVIGKTFDMVILGGARPSTTWERSVGDTSSDFSEFVLSDGVFVFVFGSDHFPRFEWGNFLTSLNASHALFRDSFEHWWNDGVHGLGDQNALIEYMKSKKRDYHTTMTLGTSKGSWAALKFGKLAEVDKVIAISPFTGCGEQVYQDFPPDCWKYLEHDHGVIPIDDLKPLYAADPIPHVHVYLTDGEGPNPTIVDRTMAERVRAHEITLIPGHTHGAHDSHPGVASVVRGEGHIKRIIFG